MKCKKCNMEIAYSYLDGFFCSCGFKYWSESFFEWWNEHVEKLLEMRKKYQFKPVSNL